MPKIISPDHPSIRSIRCVVLFAHLFVSYVFIFFRSHSIRYTISLLDTMILSSFHDAGVIHTHQLFLTHQAVLSIIISFSSTINPRLQKRIIHILK